MTGAAFGCWQPFTRFAVIFFYTYTSGRAYPVSLRRLVSDVFPLLILLAGFALTDAPASRWSKRLHWHELRWVPAAVALLWMVLLSRPLFSVSEGAGTAASVLAQIHESVPPSAVLLLKIRMVIRGSAGSRPRSTRSMVTGHCSLTAISPIRRCYNRQPMATRHWAVPLYLVTQRPELPVALLPAGYRADLDQQLPWQSTLIGQTTAPYPPPIWYFLHPVNLYRLERQ
ncbi:MAG: hypothetical protein R2932_38720 [Caldilineaceae bacterium]